MSLIPGLAVGRYPAAPRPLRLLAPGALLLSGPADHPGHRAFWGPVPRLDVESLIEATSHVVGAGGAEFPSPRKLRSLAGRNVAAVVINAMEGEPASAKDGMLLMRAPHLVLDGAVTTAQALGTRRIIVRMADGLMVSVVRAAIAERRDAAFSISIGPDAFVAGEASAIARSLRGGPALPDGNSRPPTIGWTKRAVFLSNVETFARIAVASRGDWRTSSLATVSGAVGRSGVVELPEGSTIGDLLATAVSDHPVILVAGGWHGAWLPWESSLAEVPLTREGLRSAGGRWGAGIMVVLGRDPHPADVLDAVADYLAAQTAGQCGPCVHGLPALARAIHSRVDPTAVAAQVSGRGLCAHPTAAAGALLSGAAAVRSMQNVRAI